MDTAAGRAALINPLMIRMMLNPVRLLLLLPALLAGGSRVAGRVDCRTALEAAAAVARRRPALG